MSYIALMRNPSNGALFAMVDDARTNEQIVKEWPTYDAALDDLRGHMAFVAWGGEIIEVDVA